MCFGSLVIRNRSLVIKGIAAILMASFGVNIYLSVGHTDIDFYLPLPRIWELLLGATIAFPKVQRTQTAQRFDLFSEKQNGE